MSEIVLCTLNARFSHASLGLRSLLANLGELTPRCSLIEFTINTPLADMVERVLAVRPRVLAFGVYIWNVTQTEALIRALRAKLPDTRIVLGGPELSHELDTQAIARLADHIVTGAGERAFARLAKQLLDGPRPLMRVIAGEDTDPAELALPGAFYSDSDLAHRHIYIEASRGCPFKCSFCLSALDKTARPFEPAAFQQMISTLLSRGARRLRFVDRTFNLKTDDCLAILKLFADWIKGHPDEKLFLHFELIPDRLPEKLRSAIAEFPPGVLQFEIGLQSLNPQVQKLIDRRQDNERAERNIRWLREYSHAHLHVDLIAGLPGEDITSFANGFNRLYAMAPHEIQVGLLKRLRGTPLASQADVFGLEFDTVPPYTIRQTPDVTAAQLRELKRFARHWDIIANSGRFSGSLAALIANEPFGEFMALSRYLHSRLEATHGISLERWFEHVFDYAIARSPEHADAVRRDYLEGSARGRPAFLERGLAGRGSSASPFRSDRLRPNEGQSGARTV